MKGLQKRRRAPRETGDVGEGAGDVVGGDTRVWR